MRKKAIATLLGMAALALLPSCLKSEVDEYDAWREVNDHYLDTLDTSGYTKIVPAWAPYHYVYMKWYNDRAETVNNLVPIHSSTVNTYYTLYNIAGDTIQSTMTNGVQSVFQTAVSNTVVGFQIALTNMHVGDSVRVIIPYNAGYGSSVSNSMKPYTNLIYDLKLLSIPAYEKPLK